jgi:hypothetical protein
MMRTPVLILSGLFAASLFAEGHDLTPPPAGHQMLPVVTGNGSGFMAAWVGGPGVEWRAVSAAGESIAGSAATVGYQIGWIGIARSPSDTLVVWDATSDFYGQRLSPSGRPLNLTQLKHDKDFRYDIAAAWNGSRYLVVWSNGPQLLGAFIESDGSLTAPHVIFGTANDYSYWAFDQHVVWNGQHFMVVFRRQRVIPCTSECSDAPRDPDQIRVMRLSAEGDVIDSAPIVIKGNYMRARVASSGAESLITLDGFDPSGLSTIVVHDEEKLTLDPETPLFRWPSDVFSEVVWDGAAYTVGWRYFDGYFPSWIGAAHVTRSGLPLDRRFAPVGYMFPPEPHWEWPLAPSMGANDDGDTALVISEKSTYSSSFARVRLYLVSELPPMPPPPAPRNVVSTVRGGIARIDWQSDTALRFAIDQFSNYDRTWHVLNYISGDARSTNVSAAVGDLFRLRGIGPGGISEGTITSIGSIPRRRAARQ